MGNPQHRGVGSRSRNAASGTSRRSFKSTVAFLLVGILTLMGVGSLATAASASGGHDYRVVLWQKPTTGDWPQSYVTSVTLNQMSLEAGLKKIAASNYQCGTGYQADLYLNDATTASLINGGVLNGPGNPAESWPGGSYSNAYSTSWTTDACTPPPPDTSDQKITFCHATPPNTAANGYQKLTTDVGAFYNAGHIDHSADIYPAGSFTKGGHDFSWNAQGDQSLLQYPDCAKPAPPAPNEVTPGTPVVKDFCEADNDHYGLPVGPEGVAYTRDGKDVLAEITASNTVWGTLPAGWTAIDTTHARYAFNDSLFPNNEPCAVDYVAPVTPAVVGCGEDTSLTAPDGTPIYGLQTKDGWYEGDSWDVNGVSYANAYFHPADGLQTDPTAYPSSTAAVPLLNQWFYNEGGVLEYSVVVVACDVPPTHVTATVPTVNPVCGPNNDTVTIPTKDGVNYADTGWVNGSRTITATAKDGFVLDGTSTWTFTDANVACATDYPKSAPTDGQLTLFQNPSVLAMGGAGALGLALIVGMLGFGLSRREHNSITQ